MSVFSARLRNTLVRRFLLTCSLLSVAVTAGIIWVLASESWGFFTHVPILSFFFGTRWSPILEPTSFGVLPLIGGTMLVAGGAILLAIPVGLASALYLSEHAPSRFRSISKPVLEVLAGVPTVVYGYFALTFVTPHILQWLVPGTEVYNAASASIVVGAMILPMVVSLCDDAFRSVPQSLREAGHAMAATRFEVSSRVVLPSAMSGVVAACLLALARAIGETMAVSLAAGMTPSLTLNPFTSIQTMTSYIVQVSLGDVPAGTIEYQTIFAVGMTLFVMTMTLNLLAQRLLLRFREVYE